jgi:hypothetical protein
MIKELTVQECDAIEADQCFTAGYPKEKCEAIFYTTY